MASLYDSVQIAQAGHRTKPDRSVSGLRWGSLQICDLIENLQKRMTAVLRTVSRFPCGTGRSMTPCFLYKTRGRVKFCFDPASFQVLEFRVLRVTRERDHIADVGHAGDEQQQAFEAEAETAVGRRTEAAGIEIPPISLFGHA